MVLFGLLTTLLAPLALASQTGTVSSVGLNLRTASGNILCELKQGTEVNAIGKADGDWIKVKVNAPGCNQEGFVHGGYVKGKSVTTTRASRTAKVTAEDLSFRTKPNLSEESFDCALDKDTELELTNEAPVTRGENTWVKVKLKGSVEGCAKEGWVSQAYIKNTGAPATTVSSTLNLATLPTVGRLVAASDDCADGNCAANLRPSRSEPALAQMSRVSTVISQRVPDAPARPATPPPVAASSGTFVDSLKSIMKNPRVKGTGLNLNRGLVQIPLKGKRGNIGPCGSNHYNPDSPPGVDAFANPLTACVLTSVMQDWKKICPERSGCTLQFGDISHRERAFFNTHKSHTQGLCVDVRPMRKGEFQDTPMAFTNPNYDRATTKKFISLVKSKGANLGQLFFNDAKAGANKMTGHNDHIHVCFPSNPTTRSVCNNLKVDPALCPELP